MSSAVWLDVRARALIEAETLRRTRVETGGALFGYDTGDAVVICCAYGPGPRAKHRRTTFEPHRATTAALMAAVRQASEARYRYLGSWHSHPGGAPRPSGEDIGTTERVAGEKEVLLPRPLVLIQASLPHGRSAALGELRAWRWQPELSWLLPCELVSVELQERYCPDVEAPGGWLRGGQLLTPCVP
jgi:integrative and conjugative element protein (TIGR02256 family)